MVAIHLLAPKLNYGVFVHFVFYLYEFELPCTYLLIIFVPEIQINLSRPVEKLALLLLHLQ